MRRTLTFEVLALTMQRDALVEVIVQGIEE
jgi:hypothetical protein